MKSLSLRHALFITLLTILFLLSFQVIPARKASALTKHPKCDMCHLTADPLKGGPLFAEGSDPSSSCLGCHHYGENHHPVDFIPSASSQYAAPASTFPLYNGEIRCLTCHDPHSGPTLSETPKLLRGGPYSDIRGICFKCHSREKYGEIDPHIMKDSDGNIIIFNDKPVCLICHSVMPNPKVDRTNDVRFRADVGFLCWRCHPPMPGEFFGYHFLVKPSRRTLASIKKSEEKMNVILPMVPRGRITCSTCHNPHQKEVMVHEPAGKGADSLHRLRIQSPTICIACHPTK